MFDGDTIELQRALARAVGEARSFRSDRTGPEHLLLGLLTGRHPVTDLLVSAGVDPARVREVVRDIPTAAAGPARVETARWARPWPGRSRSSISPAFSVAANAAYEASLRLALARREHAHGPEHLALSLFALDPGIDEVLSAIGADQLGVWDALAAAYPPPRRNSFLRVERFSWRRIRSRDLVHRYELATGLIAARPAMLTKLIAIPA